MPVRYLSLGEVVELHRLVIEQAGGAGGMRDLGALESAVAQPRATIGGADLYPSLAEKAAALGYSLALNHPFVDGNKRVAHAALETFLVLNPNATLRPVQYPTGPGTRGMSRLRSIRPATIR